jgi:flagellar biosynthesis/type III secretory pathway protein FliH
MRSSSRIIHREASSTPVVAGGSTVVGVVDTTRPGEAGSVVVLRGRRRAADGRTSGQGEAAALGGDPAGASVLAVKGASAILGVELQLAYRIADERGYAEGHARAVEELRAAVAAAAALAVKLEAMAPSRTNAVAHAITEVALAVARRVVGAHLLVDPMILVGALETAVGKINGSPDARVLLHPDVVEIVRQTWEATHGRSYLGKTWTFEGDPALPPGGCILRFEHGFVDAGLEAQLEEIGIALDSAVPAIWSGGAGSTLAGLSIADLAGSSDPASLAGLVVSSDPTNLADPIR